MIKWPLGDISLETFLSEYWQKKPLLIRNAFPDFEPPISVDELAGLALEEEVESRLIIQSPNDDQWTLEHGPLSEERFATLPPSHWTLLVQAVDHWVPEASDLVEHFRFIPNWRLDDLMVSFATTGGGVGPHYDNYDVFLLQATGHRRWEVGGLFGEDSPRRKDVPVLILPEWQAEQTFDLGPGDMLYLPPKVGHNGYALDDECMTYSIGFRAPSHHELFNSFAGHVEEVSKAEDRYTDADLTPQDNSGKIDPSAIKRLRTLMNQYLADDQLLAAWFGKYMTEPKYNNEQYSELDSEVDETFSLDEIEDCLNDGILLVRNEGARFAFHQATDSAATPVNTPVKLVLFVDGDEIICSNKQAELAKQLCKQRYHDQLETHKENLVLIQQLLAKGALYWQE